MYKVSIYLLLVLVIIFLAFKSFVIFKPENSLVVNKPIPFNVNWNYKVQTDLYKIYKNKKIGIIMLGDSHTYRVNWNELLGREDILNRGIDGDTTGGFLARLDTLLKEYNPSYIAILGGYNDFRKGYSFKEVQENYEQILRKIQARGIKVIINSTLYDTKGKYAKKISLLNRFLKEYCLKYKATYLNLNEKFSLNGKLHSTYSYDGIHINAKGYKFWRDELSISLSAS